MGTTSEKLTYLNTTKEKIRDSINLTGANIGTSDTFRSYATKLKLGLIDIINNGTDTLYSNFPKVSGIGSNLSLTPTYEAPMKLNEIQGDTLQDGTPTPDSPVPIQNVTGLQNVTISNADNTQSNTYEVNLGKNLYDVSTCTNAYINSTGVITSANTNLLTDYIKIDNTQKYTISLNTEFYFIGCAYYDKNKTYLSRDTINNSSSLTITIPNNTEYIRIWMSYATNTNISKTSVMQYEPMIEKGTQRTLYSEYFTPIELNKIGIYQDYIYKSNGNWYLHQEIGKVILDGSENITNPSNTGYSNTILRFNITVADKKYGKSGTIVDDILSNNFTCEKLDYDARTIESIAGHAAEHIVIIFIDKSRLSTENVQGFKTWLSTHNTMVYYVLATPTDTLITNTELIEDLETLYTAKSQEGTTNISITSEDLEMILNISALRGEV